MDPEPSLNTYGELCFEIRIPPGPIQSVWMKPGDKFYITIGDNNLSLTLDNPDSAVEATSSQPSNDTTKNG